MDRFAQRDLFPQERPPERDDRPPEAPEPSESEERMPAPPEGAAEAPPEAARPRSRTRAERTAQRRRRQAILDDALGRLGASGRQLLSDTESPFAQAQEDLKDERERAEEERKRRASGSG